MTTVGDRIWDHRSAAIASPLSGQETVADSALQYVYHNIVAFRRLPIEVRRKFERDVEMLRDKLSEEYDDIRGVK